MNGDSVSVATVAWRNGFLRFSSNFVHHVVSVAVSAVGPESEPPSSELTSPSLFGSAQLVRVPCTMVRFLQAMAEDGRGAHHSRLGSGCSAQHLQQPNFSL